MFFTDVGGQTSTSKQKLRTVFSKELPQKGSANIINNGIIYFKRHVLNIFLRKEIIMKRRENRILTTVEFKTSLSSNIE